MAQEYVKSAMNLIMALHQMAGRTDLFAVRAEGEVLVMTRMMSIKSVGTGKPQPWKATFGAVVADNWQVVDAKKLQEMMGQGAAGEE